MPLLANAVQLIRANLEKIQRGQKAPLVAIGTLTDIQLAAINALRGAEGFPPIIAEVVFIGTHIYKNRAVKNGYTIDDLVDQITSALHHKSVVLDDEKMTAMENPEPRADRYGNQVKDRAVFECTARHPRPELFSVIPKGDKNKPRQ